MLIRVTIVELYTLSTSAGVDIEFLCDLFHRPLVTSLVCSPVTSRLFQLPGNLKTTGIRFWNIILQCPWLEMLSGRLGLSRGGDAVTGAVGGCFCTRGVVSRTQQSKRNRPSCYHTHTYTLTHRCFTDTGSALQVWRSVGAQLSLWGPGPVLSV